MSLRVLSLVGTRPEAIKVAPVALALREAQWAEHLLVTTAQHPALLAGALAPFRLEPDAHLTFDRSDGSLHELAAASIATLGPALAELEPDVVLVQGDTLTAFLGALVAFWAAIPVVHLEAGLRTGDLRRPFPEEANRRLIAPIASLHLAPTSAAAAALRAEGVIAERIHVTGNTVVDALEIVTRAPAPFADERLDALVASGDAIVLVTVHRRESWGAPLRAILGAVRTLADRHPEVTFVLPVHPNPIVVEEAERALTGAANVLRTEPLGYASFARLLRAATLVLSDSGGIQEEAPTFGVPALVLRERTERGEGIDAGVALLVGVDPDRIVAETERLLDDPEARAAMAATANPYGDGNAATRCAEAIACAFIGGPPPSPFVPCARAAEVVAPT